MPKRKTNNKFISELYGRNITPIDKYIKDDCKIRFGCDVCGFIWSAKPNNILNGKGCPKCVGLARKTHDEFMNEISTINPDVELLGEYINSHSKIEVKCNICNYVWFVRTGHLLAKHGCPKCNESIGERVVKNFLNDNCILYEREYGFNDCKNINILPFDFYLPELNCCIEYDGEQHYRPISYFGGVKMFNDVVYRDGLKTAYCENNGIKLLRIRYDDDIIHTLKEFL